MLPLRRAVPRQSRAIWRAYATKAPSTASDAAPAAAAAESTEAPAAPQVSFTKKPSVARAPVARAAPVPLSRHASTVTAHLPSWTSEANGDSSADVSWSTSFHGIAAQPVTREQYAILVKPLPEKDIEVKPDGIIYLPEIKYRRRLNEAFGPMGWGLIPRGEPEVKGSVVTREYALIINGRFASQALGENTFFSPEQLPSSIEGCKSNALMRCCKDLGIASELWDPDFIRRFKQTKMKEAWVEHATTKKKRLMWFKTGQVQPVYPWKLS